MYFGEHLNKIKPEVGAEIGVWKGDHAIRLLKTIPTLKKLYLVDMWKPYGNFYSKDSFYDEYKECMEKIKPFQKRVVVLQMSSLEAARKIVDKALDFVYIDANHTYEYVRNDILAWLPKVRKGGIVSGHDYGGKHKDVKVVVDELITNVNVFGKNIWWTKK